MTEPGFEVGQSSSKAHCLTLPRDHISRHILPPFTFFPPPHPIQAHLRDVVDLLPDHVSKANITVKQVTQIFWFASACKSYIYTTLLSIKGTIAL